MPDFGKVLSVFLSLQFKFDMDNFNVEFLPWSVNVKSSIERDEQI